jgi:hypothetical protein
MRSTHKNEVRRMLKGLLLSVGVFLIMGALVFVAYSHLISWLSPFDDMPFDAHEWRKLYNYPSADNPRGPMAEILRKNLLNTRPTKNEVLALLGDPDCMSEEDKQRQDFLSYGLGAWSALGFAPDFCCLQIYFDNEGRVRTAMIRGN